MNTKAKTITLIFLLSISICRLAARELALPAPAVAGVYIENLSTGEVLADINGDRTFVPASVTKAITSASALVELAGDFRFVTRVWIDGPVKGSTAEGNVIVGAIGDPTIESEHFEEYHGFTDSVAANLRRLGIERVKGKVIIDTSSFLEQDVPSGWMEEDLAWPYGTGHHAVNYRDNAIELSMPSRRSYPAVPGLKVSSAGGKGRLKVSRKRGNRTIYFKGRPRRRGETSTLANPDPAASLRHDIEASLAAASITVDGKTVKGEGKEPTEVYTHVSPSLSDILRSLMFRSDNMMAESMLRALAPGESRESAVDKELKLWELRDIDTEQICLEDGSGLSRNDRLTPYFMADVLAWMAETAYGNDYASLFPKAGLDGTMKKFLVDTPLEGRIALKTGSMKGVQSYAGYLLGDDGTPSHVIIFMINRFNCARQMVKSAIENYLLELFVPKTTTTSSDSASAK